jgi:DNA-binding MarR family transcriptional regulator
MSEERPHNMSCRDDGDGGLGHTPTDEAEPPIGRAFHRVMRAIIFDDPPDPELDALPLAQLRLLWTVHYAPDATMKDFSERLGVSQSTVTQLAERLVRRGLIDRKADAADRRVVRLHVSDIGSQLLMEASGRQQETFRNVWARIDSAHRTVVLHGLELLGDAAEAFRAEQGPLSPPLSLSAEPHDEMSPSAVETGQPVLDLMARRIRGKSLNK